MGTIPSLGFAFTVKASSGFFRRSRGLTLPVGTMSSPWARGICPAETSPSGRADISGGLEQLAYVFVRPAPAGGARKTLRLHLPGQIRKSDVCVVEPIKRELYGVDLRLIGAGQQSDPMPGLGHITRKQAAYKMTVGSNRPQSRPKIALRIYAAGLGVGNVTPQRFGRSRPGSAVAFS